MKPTYVLHEGLEDLLRAIREVYENHQTESKGSSIHACVVVMLGSPCYAEYINCDPEDACAFIAKMFTDGEGRTVVEEKVQ